MKPTFVHSNSVVKDNAYQLWFGELKSRLRSHQVKAAMNVNTEMLEFYWSLGRDLVQKKAETQWGTGVVEQLSLDLKDAFPGMKGFSTTNIWYSKKWYLFYNEELIKIQQLLEKFQCQRSLGLYHGDSIS